MEESLWRIEWNAELAFGVPELDHEHRHLVDLVNKLNEAIASGATTEKLLGPMNVILVDSWNHFRHEETLLTDANYPFRKGHKLLHELLKAELEHVKQDCSRDQDTKSWPEYGLLVKQLFFDHFVNETKKYREFRAQ